jgi:penicillin-binding protein 1C
MRQTESSFKKVITDINTLPIVDRNGEPLTITYQNKWNSCESLKLYQIPLLLRQAFVISEDKRFYNHQGIDWYARLGAILQNIKSGKKLRGASTISEQVIRMLHTRPRTLWSKWIEGFEAVALENKFLKNDILEFYLNQIPYASNRKGISQAARFYFNRSILSLNKKEILALVVLARAPSSYDLYHPNGEAKIEKLINRLGNNLYHQGIFSIEDLEQVKSTKLELAKPRDPVNAFHFAHFIKNNFNSKELTRNTIKLRTTLDAAIQGKVQGIIDSRLKSLRKKLVNNAAALVVDHKTGEIITWVVAGATVKDKEKKLPGSKIDAVTTLRQPGSSQKAFLYALALELKWTPVTQIDDLPLYEAVGNGLHRFKNYSNIFYGKVSLREALANSLNIPAIHTIRFTGVERYIETLHQLGFKHLTRGAEIYDEGLALGNGEITLFELVQAYAAIANQGMFRPLKYVLESNANDTQKRVFSAESASIIANILSDPWARRHEFGLHSILNLPVQTAVKTGTSTDYRDAWAVGFNSRYVVGVWMGNLDRKPTNGVSGASGPALAMRSIFSELNRNIYTAPLYLSPKLIKQEICTGELSCMTRTEYFIAGTEASYTTMTKIKKNIELIRPTNGLQIALDPRIPMQLQKIQFELKGIDENYQVKWLMNNQYLSTTQEGKFLWQLKKGNFKLKTQIYNNGNLLKVIEANFIVK